MIPIAIKHFVGLQFGDKDGTGTSAQFQHPLGVLCGADGIVYITDSYNHKIKAMDPNTLVVKTIAGIGKAGFKDGSSLSAQVDSADQSNHLLLLKDFL
jgi:hypothetical protein